VTVWGAMLLVAYVGLGLGLGPRRAMRYAAGLTVLVLAVVSVGNGAV
jgi:hypothetical protein